MVMSSAFPVYRSPVRRALNEVWRDDVTYDLRHHLRFATSRIEVCRQFAADIGLGAYTQAFGEDAERLFCENAWLYYRLRDKQGAIDLYLQNIMGTYVSTFYLNAGGAIVGLDLCISPPLQAVALPAVYLDEFLRAARWLLPWFAALPVTGPQTGLTVTACEEETAGFIINTGFHSRVTFDAVGAGS